MYHSFSQIKSQRRITSSLDGMLVYHRVTLNPVLCEEDHNTGQEKHMGSECPQSTLTINYFYQIKY